jgi:hypothetical protein
MYVMNWKVGDLKKSVTELNGLLLELLVVVVVAAAMVQ